MPPVLLGLFALAVPSVHADDARAVASKNQCMTCHKVEGKLIGPSYKDVAARYKGDAEALDKLSASVKKGSQGVWGPMPMPSNHSMSEEDLKRVVSWILSLGD